MQALAHFGNGRGGERVKKFQCECLNETFEAIRFDDDLVNLKCTVCGELFDIAEVLDSMRRGD